MSAVQPRQTGIFTVFIWGIIILIPWLALSWHFNEIFNQGFSRSNLLAEASIMAEMKEFRQALSGRVAVEKMMRETEERSGLSVKQSDFDFFAGQDPLIYNENTASTLAEFLKNEFRITPSYILSFGYKGRHLHQAFIGDFSWRSAQKKEMLKNVLAYNLIDFIKAPSQPMPEFAEAFAMVKYGPEQRTVSMHKNHANNLLRLFFSGIAEFPSNIGVCKEFFSSRIGGDKIFIFTNGLHNRGKIYGGYLTIFAGSELTPKFLLKMAQKSRDQRFRRSYEKYDPQRICQFIQRHDALEYFEAVPAEFLNNHFRDLYSPQNMQPLLMLKVSSRIGHFHQGLRKRSQSFSFVQKHLILMLFAFFIYFLLFKQNIKMKLRTRFIALTALVVLAPFVMMAYFSGLVIENLERLNSRKIETEASTRMYEITRFVDNLRLKRQVAALAAKKRLSDRILEGDVDIETTRSNQVLTGALNADLSTVSLKGNVRVLNFKNGDKEPRKMVELLGTNYLHKLGVLDTGIEKNRRTLQLVNYAGGFLDDLSRNYLEGLALAKESQETKDLGELNDLHRMIYFLLPASHRDNFKVSGIGFIHLFGITRFSGAFDQVGEDPKLLLNAENESAVHRFALAERSFAGPPEKYFPRNLGDHDSLKLLLDQAIVGKTSGQIHSLSGNEARVSTWRYFPDQEYLAAGITVARPDLWLSLLSSVFPVLTFLFLIVSLILLSDFIYEFLVKPINGFLKFIKEIERQKFSTRIKIEAVDEFSELASSFNDMAEGLEQREKLRRFVSDRLFSTIQQGFDLEKSSVSTSEMSVLAADIRSFTSITEKHDANEIVCLLNDYFTLMGEAITLHNGIVERFVSDAIVAVFYPESDGENHSLRAVKAAIQMRRALNHMNKRRHEQGLFQIENGIGIVTGTATTAVTGSEKGRKIFTIIGPIVTEAETLESQTGTAGKSRILICRHTAGNCATQIDLQIYDSGSQSFIVSEREL